MSTILLGPFEVGEGTSSPDGGGMRTPFQQLAKRGTN